MSTDTVFRIASMVKLLTSVAAMQLVERGRLRLDEPAANVDPMLSAPRVLTGFDDKGMPQLREAREPLTLRNLLTHTSGIPDLDLERLRRTRPSYQALLKRVLASEPAFEPGSRYAYASDGFYLLAEVLRARTGKTMVPVVVTPADEAMNDSTHITRALEAAHPEPLLRPADAGRRGLDALIEDWADEWIVRAMLATGPEGSVERYRELSRDRSRFGYVDQNAVTRAWLATGRVFPHLLGVPAADDE